MASQIGVIVGLGNPGAEYADTRHNAGFWWVDALARSAGIHWSREAKFHGMTGRAGECWLLKPATFMNHSGRSLAALTQFYKLAPEQILVVHDELDLPPGMARLKQGGGHGGHNGLRDIIERLGSKDFWRLRLGIGHPGDKNQVVDYVLHRPSKDDYAAITTVIVHSMEVLPLIAAGEMQRAMHQLHTDKK